MDDNYYPRVKKSEIEYLYYRYNAYVMEYDERAAQIIKDIYIRVQKIWIRLINIRIGTLLRRNKKFIISHDHSHVEWKVTKNIRFLTPIKECHCLDMIIKTIGILRRIKK